MTKIFIAQTPVPEPPITPHQSYSISSDARAELLKVPDIEEPLKYPIPGKGLYQMTGGSSFDFEINILDPSSKRPVRAVEVEAGLVKGFTDKLGRLIMHLPRGPNKVIISGFGYVEEGSFTPKRIDFDPTVLEVDLDCDEIVTFYTSGEVVKGERHNPGNPGHNPGEFSEWLGKYWWALGLAGAAGITFYYLGKSGAQKT